MATLCAALRGNAALRELDLTRNAIRDEGLLALVELLEEEKEDPPGGGGGGGGGGCSRSAVALRVVRVGRNSVASQALRDRLSAVLALRRLHDDEAAAAAANSPAVPEAPSSPVGTPAPPPELPAAGSRQQGWQLVEPSAAVSDEGLARANKVAAAWVDVRPTYAGTTLGSGFELL